MQSLPFVKILEKKSIKEAEAGRFPVQSQPGVSGETLFHKAKSAWEAAISFLVGSDPALQPHPLLSSQVKHRF